MNPAEDYILKQPEPYRSILMHLQVVIEHTLPDVDLKFKYRLPFYYINGKPCCYLNNSKGYVDLGLWYGAHLTKHVDKLVGGRRVIKSLRYTSLEEIDDEVLIDVLKEAYAVRNNKFYNKK